MGARVHLGQNNDKEVHALNVAVTNFGHRGEKGIQIMPTNTNTFKKFIVNLMHLLWLTNGLQHVRTAYLFLLYTVATGKFSVSVN
jgi:hypothetical protein